MQAHKRRREWPTHREACGHLYQHRSAVTGVQTDLQTQGGADIFNKRNNFPCIKHQQNTLV